MVFRISRLAGAFAGVTALTVACGGANSDRAGGAAHAETLEPVVLTMAQPNGGAPMQIAEWVAEIAARSGGTLEIHLSNAWRLGEPEFETRTIDDVQAGEADLAWVGARAFDRVGVTSFQPMLAPMLVDSNDLQAAVFDAGLPDEMLAGLDAIDVVGLGVLPGPMRKILGVEHAFVSPADFAGEVIGTQDSAVSEMTITTLGGSPHNLPGDADISEVDAYEQQLGSIAGNEYWQVAGFVTANVNLWPRPLVLFMNGDRYDELSDEHQAVLRDAASATVEFSLTASRDEDVSAVPYLCERGMTFAVADDAGLIDLRAALQPVYEEIGRDPDNARLLTAIEALKDDLGAPPDSAECPTVEPINADPATYGFPEGTFTVIATEEDFERVCGFEFPDDFESVLDVTFEDGFLEQWETRPDGSRDRGFRASYTVARDLVEFTEPGVSGTLLFRWSFDGSTLTLSDLADDHGECVHRGVWEHEWTLAEPGSPPTSGAAPQSTDE